MDAQHPKSEEETIELTESVERPEDPHVHVNKEAKTKTSGQRSDAPRRPRQPPPPQGEQQPPQPHPDTPLMPPPAADIPTSVASVDGAVEAAEVVTPSAPFPLSEASPAVLLSVVLGLLLVLLLLRRLRGGAVGARVRRHTVLLLGLPSSGKTALFAHLTAAREQESPARQFCTSMEVNKGAYHGGGAVTVVDYPGHPRLRSNVLPHLSEAKKLIITIDTVTIHDDRHQGAVALADYLLSLFESPAFYGIREVCFACTHRDEVTSYNIKAVKKLLEAAMARAIRARHGDVGRVDRVVDTQGKTIEASKHAKKQREKYSRGRHLELQCEDEEGNSFSLDSSVNMSLGGLAISFVDVSSVPDAAQHPFHVKEVEAFVEQ